MLTNPFLTCIQIFTNSILILYTQIFGKKFSEKHTNMLNILHSTHFLKGNYDSNLEFILIPRDSFKLFLLQL